MKTKHLHSITKQALRIIAFFAAFLLFTGCVFYNLEIPNGEGTASNGTIQVTIGMPEDTPETRISLTPDGLNIKLAWEVGDEIYFVFTQKNIIEGKHTVILTVDNIENDGKKAVFTLEIPGGITEGKFNLYGVYGGTGFSNEEPYEINLSTSWTGALTEVEDRKALLLRFEKEDIPMPNPSVSVIFEHVGSLFHLALKNTGISALNNITKAELVSQEEIPAHQPIKEPRYDPVTGRFLQTIEVDYSLPFIISPTNLPVEEVLHFWGWYPPIAGKKWPALRLQITVNGIAYVSVNEKPKRSLPTEAGKVYHFFAVTDGKTVRFTESNFIIYGEFTDNRDGNKYKTVDIGNQVWMAENLKYLPLVYSSEDVSKDESRYYVYDYVYDEEKTSEENVAAAKATTNYQTYGVLYNWKAALEVCPPGWHLPSNPEWIQLEDYLSVNGFKYDGTFNLERENASVQVSVKNIAKSMAALSGWYGSINEGAVGNTDYFDYRNKSGFSALPGGLLKIPIGSPVTPVKNDEPNYFDGIGERCWFWSATQHSPDGAYIRIIRYVSADVFSPIILNMSEGYTVRCVKD